MTTGLLALVLLTATPELPCEARADLEALQLTEARARSLCALAQTAEGAEARPELLASILDRDEFAGARSRQEDAIGLLFRRIARWLELLFSTSGGQVFVESYRVLVLAAAFLVVALVGLRWVRTRALRRTPAPRGHAFEGALELDDPAAHLQRARETLAGDPRQAIREGLLALLSSFERRNWARPDRVKTNRELTDELDQRGAPREVSDRARQLLRWFDGAFYSLDPVPPPDAERFLGDVETLVRGGAA